MIFSITLFGGMFGVIGMIVGVPIFAVFYAAVRAIVSSMLENKNLPSETATYENLDYIDEEGFHETPPRTKKSRRRQRNMTEEVSEEKSGEDSKERAGKDSKERTGKDSKDKSGEEGDTSGSEEGRRK